MAEISSSGETATVTKHACCIKRNVLASLDVHELPLHFSPRKKTTRDGNISLDQDKLLDRMKRTWERRLSIHSAATNKPTWQIKERLVSTNEGYWSTGPCHGSVRNTQSHIFHDNALAPRSRLVLLSVILLQVSQTRRRIGRQHLQRNAVTDEGVDK